jgi:hypothetical protein
MKNILKKVGIITGATLFLAFTHAKGQGIITEWTFDNLTNGSTNTTPTPFAGKGTATSVGMTSTGTIGYPTTGATGPDASNINAVKGTDTNNTSSSNNVWRLVGSNGWNSTTAIGTQGAQFDVSTAGFNDISFSFDVYITSQGEANLQAEYSTNGGTTWINAPLTYSATPVSPATGKILANSTNGNIVDGTYFHAAANNGTNVWYNGLAVNLSSVAAASNDANFEVRIVNASTGSADVEIKDGGALNNTSGNWSLDNVQIDGEAIPEPSTYAMILGAFGVLTFALRRKLGTSI